jgi:phosphoribosyl 1,2-cyclic phosphate phosphodiesterase
MRVTVLGCGTSSGVPQIGCACAVCRSPDPRNKRRRCAIFIEAGGQRILVDTGPDLREQCISAGIGAIDALLYTHAHADHVHGIDDLRSINNVIMAPIEAYADEQVFARIRSRFPYVFEGGRSHFGFWRPDINPHPIDGPFRIGDAEVIPFRQKHGRGESWGFRIGPFAYSTDTDGLSDEALATLRGVEVWIVDALRDKPHPSHAHLEIALGWIEQVAPQQAYLTHMNHEVDYADWARRLPRHVLPAHDGLVVSLAPGTTVV